MVLGSLRRDSATQDFRAADGRGKTVQMLRITPIDDETSRVTLKLEGRLVTQWMAMLETECARFTDAGRQVTLDLADVVFLDCDAAALLDRLRAGGITLVRSPAFIQELIDETCR